VIGSYVKAGGLGAFFLLVTSQLLMVGSQAMANIWLCMWSDSRCMPQAWNKSLYSTYELEVADKELAVYGGLGAIQGLLKFPENKIILMVLQTLT
jgi:hypothetical protein